MANVSKVNVNSTDYNIKDSNAMHKGVDYVTAGKKANTTLGSNATAEGYNTTASGSYSHAEGQNTIASGLNSHAEGSDTTASKPDAHAEGSHTTASGEQAHAEGSYTTASGYYAHSEGFYTTASGNHSHAEGVCTKASSPNQHVEGKYNVEDTNGTYAHIIGNGPSDSERKNIFTVNWDGDVNAGRSNGLTNDTKLPTGADVISYLNSNLVNDSGWKVMQVNSQYGSGLVFYRKSFGIVTVNLQNQKFENYTPGTDFTVATLPSGFLPKGMTLYRLYGDQGYCYINTNGNISINASTASVWAGFNVAYHSA